MRITLIIHDISSAGGAERVLTSMANSWAERGWPVTILTLDRGESPPFYALARGVVHRPLGLAGDSPGPMQAVVANLRRVRRLREAIRAGAPDVVISFMDKTNVLTLLATAGASTPIIVSERNCPIMHRVGRAWTTLRRWLYPRADCVVVQSRDSLGYFSPEVRGRARVIPNPIFLPARGAGAVAGPSGGRKLIAMGRLDDQKGFDLLIRAFARVTGAHPDWSLEIWGEGKKRPDLERLVVELGVSGRVRLPGITREPGTRMGEADLFVLSSRYEGFPNVLCEAMAVGLPPIAFDCPTGPRDIIRDGVDGVLIPPGDVEALASAMGRLMGDEAGRQRLAARAPEVAERFGIGRIMGLWDEAIGAVVPAVVGRDEGWRHQVVGKA
jgi:glycosyltransferase involved in cell wall biosynthesis